MPSYHVFHRTFWKHNLSWPDKREPEAGKKHTIASGVSEKAARLLCKEWNESHDAGPLSDKAEYEEE